MSFELRYVVYNSHSILIEWPAIIDPKTLKDVLNYKKRVEKFYSKQKVEVVNAYSSMLIIYKFTIDDVNSAFTTLKKLYTNSNKLQNSEPVVWEIPVCYEDDFALDLSAFSEEKQLSKLELIALHSEATYTVYFMGFLPGFLYLGGLNSKLFLDRKNTPKLNVKKGSVAIGGQQTGIYPQDSPGGWHVIGNTPIQIFNASEDPPCKIRAGDKVKFKPISKDVYLDIQKQVEAKSFELIPQKEDA